MIKTENLLFSYEDDSRKSFSFPDINLEINENLVILGRSGIGKTTFMHLLAGLLKPIQGSIHINNTDINNLSKSKLTTFRGEHIGLVFQKKYAIRSLNVIENLRVRLLFCKQKVDNDLIEELLEDLGLSPHKKSKIQTLSEGELQRLGIAMAIVHRPKIILADEPTSSLDDENANIVMELMLRQAEKTNANLLVITHDQRVKAFFNKTIAL
jgi:putative ABC transport system ATP-binding protein